MGAEAGSPEAMGGHRRRSIKRAGPVAIAMLVFFTAAMGTVALLGGANSTFTGGSSSLLVAPAAFMVVGALIVAQRPDNAVGWVFSSIGLLSCQAGFSLANTSLYLWGGPLRRETDLDQLSRDLVSVVDATMQPPHASLWLHSSPRSER
ncbi:MAG: hypothetical protein ACRDK3_13220 [Actinomycetota bacterium]